MTTAVQRRAAAIDAADAQALRERRHLHGRINQMRRAQAAVCLAIDGFPARERCIILNEVLTEALRELRQSQLADR